MRALDELRFGPQRTLNLRDGLPTATEAVRRAEAWLREQQVRGEKEVLIITGRGSHSVGKIPVIKEAVEKLLFSLRRRGVIAAHREHNPGAFVVEPAPLRTLLESAPRRRDGARVPPKSPGTLHGIDLETVNLLRQLAERSLDALGVRADAGRVEDEMQRHLAAIVRALPSGGQTERQLHAALRAAIAQYD